MNKYKCLYAYVYVIYKKKVSLIFQMTFEGSHYYLH